MIETQDVLLKVIDYKIVRGEPLDEHELECIAITLAVGQKYVGNVDGEPFIIEITEILPEIVRYFFYGDRGPNDIPILKNLLMCEIKRRRLIPIEETF